MKRLEKMETIAAIVDRDVQPFVFPGPEKPLSPPMMTQCSPPSAGLRSSICRFPAWVRKFPVGSLKM